MNRRCRRDTFVTDFRITKGAIKANVPAKYPVKIEFYNDRTGTYAGYSNAYVMVNPGGKRTLEIPSFDGSGDKLTFDLSLSK